MSASRRSRIVRAAGAVLGVLAAAALAGGAQSTPLYSTSFEQPVIDRVTSISSGEWQKTPIHPGAGNANDVMYLRRVGDNDPNLFNPARAHTGNQSAYQHETFSMNCAMHDFGQDMYENFYVRAWVWLDPAKERLINVQKPCPDIDIFITGGAVTAVDDGGQVIPGGTSCMKTDPSISDAHTYFHSGYPDCQQPSPSGSGVSCPLGPYIVMTSGAAAGKKWDIYTPTYYGKPGFPCAGPPYGYNTSWDKNRRLHVRPQAGDPNPQLPYAAGVRPGDTYEIRGATAPLYRAIQMWVENRGDAIPGDLNYRWQNQKDFAKFGIYHRYGGDAYNAIGAQCTDTNNWKFLTKKNADATINDYYGEWTDTGVARSQDTAGWHSLQVNVYADRFDFLVDDAVVASAPRYTAEGPVPFNRVQIGGLAVSQEFAFWDDIEIGTLPGGADVQDLASVQAARSLPDGTWVSLPDAVVDQVGDGWFHIQGIARGGGIRCSMPEVFTNGGALVSTVSVGDRVKPVGKIGTLNGCEKILMPMNLNIVARNQPIEPPVGTNHAALLGPPSMSGWNISTTGWVVDDGDGSTYFYIKDANEPFTVQPYDPKIKVYGETPGFFNFVRIRGIAACENGEAVIYAGSEDGAITIEWP